MTDEAEGAADKGDVSIETEEWTASDYVGRGCRALLLMLVVFSVIGFLVLVVLMMFVLWDFEEGRQEGREREMEQERLEMERLIEANSD